MQENFLEGSIVLEMLAEIGKVDEFMDAVDSDDLSTIRKLMKLARIDKETIEMVMQKIDSDFGD